MKFRGYSLVRFVLMLSLLLCVAVTTVQISRADEVTEPAKPTNRAEATDVVRGLRRIVTPRGIEAGKVVRIGGIDQWVTIRGNDTRNPVLIVLHGGPGYVEMPLGWWYGRPWEEYFTVVQWDQRGAGKTFLLNDPKVVAPTMTRERLIQDTEELVTWVRGQLGKQKVFVWGHSWGSYLGLQLALRHPEWLYAYIATGQVTNSPESERRGWRFAMAAAAAAHNVKAVAELRAIAPYSTPGKSPSLAAIMVEHRWVDFFGGVMAYRTSQEDESHAGRLSPDYTDTEARHIYDGNSFSEHYLLADLLSLDLSHETDLKCPLVLLEGRHDFTVNSDVAHEWFEQVKAPEKHFIWFEHSAHEPTTEEPGRFLLSLIKYARPLAGEPTGP
jgi:proline iminopeptidase